MSSWKLRHGMFRFTGEYVHKDGEVFATCNEAPVFGSGETEAKATEDIRTALLVYLKTLLRRGELDKAVKLNKLCII